MLSISDALRLVELVGHHIDDKYDVDLFQFTGKILNSMEQAGEMKNYVLAIELMTGMEQQDVLKMTSIEAITTFIKGLVDNDIFSLKKFYKQIGGKHGST